MYLESVRNKLFSVRVWERACVGRGGEAWWVSPAECPVLLHVRHSSDTVCNAESLVCVPRPADNSWWLSKWWRLLVQSTTTFGAERHVIESVYSRNKCLHKQDWGDQLASQSNLFSSVFPSRCTSGSDLMALFTITATVSCLRISLVKSTGWPRPAPTGILFLVGCHSPVFPPMHIKLLVWRYN